MGLVYYCERCKRDIRPYDGCLERPQPCRCCLEAEVERLQGIVDKLPKTADGVSVVPGVDHVWQVLHGEMRRGWIATVAIDTWGGDKMIGIENVKDWYSTREAAEAKGGLMDGSEATDA